MIGLSERNCSLGVDRHQKVIELRFLRAGSVTKLRKWIHPGGMTAGSPSLSQVIGPTVCGLARRADATEPVKHNSHRK